MTVGGPHRSVDARRNDPPPARRRPHDVRRAADDLVRAHRAPLAAVAALARVVAQDEVLAGAELHFAQHSETPAIGVDEIARETDRAERDATAVAADPRARSEALAVVARVGRMSRVLLVRAHDR